MKNGYGGLRFTYDLWCVTLVLRLGMTRKFNPVLRREEIKNAIESAKVAVLLVSADFLASDFIATDELPSLLNAAQEDGATILPVIVSPSRFRHTQSLSQFQTVNNPSKPLTSMDKHKREEVFVQVSEHVAAAVETFCSQRDQAPATPTAE